MSPQLTTPERLAAIEVRLTNIEGRVAGIYKILTWIATSIGGAIFLAVGNFIVNGGFAQH